MQTEKLKTMQCSLMVNAYTSKIPNKRAALLCVTISGSRHFEDFYQNILKATTGGL